jgi:mannose-6-phosphate isomerase-like protein (cupin superfamily)
MERPRVLGPGEGARECQARGSVMRFKAMAEQDDGDFSLMERTLPVGGRRPPPHRHTNCSEAYFVLDGEVAVRVEEEELRLGPEQFVLVPGGRPTRSGTPGTFRPGCSSSMRPPWTPTSPGCTSCGAPMTRRRRTRNER